MPRDEARAMPLDSPASQEVRTPPASLEAEQAFLGALLTNNRVYDQVGDFLRPEHFIHPAHALIYETCQQLIDRGRPANPITLRPVVEREEDLFAEAGGVRYLAALVGSVVSIINGPEYARLIADYWHKRELIAVGRDLTDHAHSMDIDESASAIQEAAEARLLDLVTGQSASARTVHVSEAVDQALAQFEDAYRNQAPVGLTFGFPDLDRRLGGIADTDLVILAGRPSMGKTALAMALAWSVARAGVAVDFYSAEMGPEGLAERMVSSESRVALSRLQDGSGTPEEMERALRTRDAFRSLPLDIQDCAGISVNGIMARARRQKRRKDIGLIVVDYIQILGQNRGARPENTTAAITAISKGLKHVAKELHVPVLALSQLSRACESRDDKRPMLSDLRDSGAIEQDADKVMFAYRDQYYLERGKPKQKPEESNDKFANRQSAWETAMAGAQNKLDVIVAKNRRGRVGTASLYYELNTQRIESLAQGDML